MSHRLCIEKPITQMLPRLKRPVVITNKNANAVQEKVAVLLSRLQIAANLRAKVKAVVQPLKQLKI